MENTMKKFDKWLKITAVVMGIISIGFFVFDLIILLQLQPKMIHFDSLSERDYELVNYSGYGLILFLLFCLLSIYRLLRFQKYAKRIAFLSIVSMVAAIAGFLLTFSFIGLLDDIGNQYEQKLNQPEWNWLYPVIVLQIAVAVWLVCMHVLDLNPVRQEKQITLDGNIFLMVHYTGLLCGFLGFIFLMTGFFYVSAWNLLIHSTIVPIIFLFPYILILGYWLICKLKEKSRLWFDEKQLQDIGRSSILTLIIQSFFMTGLFFLNYNNLAGVVRLLWLPIDLFLCLTSFSVWNLIFYTKG